MRVAFDCYFSKATIDWIIISYMSIYLVVMLVTFALG